MSASTESGALPPVEAVAVEAVAAEAVPVEAVQSVQFGWSRAALLRQWTARVPTVASELPHGVRGYQVLSVAVHESPPTQAALAERLGIDRTVMTYLLDELVDCGVVERKQDPEDRRARRIVPTVHGRAVVKELDAQVSREEDALLSALRPEERRILRDLLGHAAEGAAPGDDRCATASPAAGP